MSNALQVADLELDGLTAREWLVGNGIGGFASSTVAGMNTRRYHGLLVAAMAPPVRRMVLLSRVEETLLCDGREFYLACNEYPGVIWPRGHDHVRAFSNDPFPRWGYQGDGWTLEKQVRLLRGENTVLVSYTLWGGLTTADLELRPLLALRPMHDLSYQWNGRLRADLRSRGHYHVAATSRTPEVFFAHDGSFEQRPNWYLNTIYRREQERGYPGLEDLWCPGVVKVRLMPGQAVYFACSADPFELSHVINRASRQLSPAVDLQLRTAPVTGAVLTPKAPAQPAPVARKPAEAAATAADSDYDALVRATESFILTTRLGDSTGCTVQYPWNAPSPRPALAGFAGLYLVPNRIADARSLLLALVPRLREGLLPTEFPEDGSEPVYAGADVALWFVNAVYQYLAYTGDAPTVRRHLLESIYAIIDHYRRGTDLGIRTDDDGLLASGVAGQGVTWMDAKSGDWVATPRQGRAVEVNALWYNALCVAAELARRFEGPDRVDRSADYAALARSAREAFNRRFWNEAAGCCYDVIGDEDGAAADASVRPNQLFAMSLPFAVLSPDRHGRVVERVRQDLLTPVGVRTLAPSDPQYRGRYEGDAHARDRAYHNGPAFPWLLGPMVTAVVRTFGRGPAVLEQARAMLRPSIDRLRGDGLGHLRELFDGDAPHAPGGATTAPLAVAEILRCYAEDLLGRNPALPPRPPAGEAAPQSPSQPVPPDVMHPA